MDINQLVTIVGVALGVILVGVLAVVPFLIDRSMGPDMDEPDLPAPTPLHPAVPAPAPQPHHRPGGLNSRA